VSSLPETVLQGLKKWSVCAMPPSHDLRQVRTVRGRSCWKIMRRVRADQLQQIERLRGAMNLETASAT
jgi:hypothetical protein